MLQDASMVLHPGQKVALVGANGSGKSSVFQMLLGQLHLDGGQLDVPDQWRIAHMAQEVGTSDRSALDYVLDGHAELRAVEADLLAAEQAGDDHRMIECHAALDHMDGYNARVRGEQLLMGLGFQMSDTAKPVNSFSGGWRIRLNLAQALMCPSDLLLLDEPTNHLDLDAELWLEGWLQRYPGTLMLISHARDFIDSTCDGIVHIEHQTLTAYKGNYSAFETQRAERLALQQASYQKQQQRISEIEDFVRRFRAKATKAKQAQSRLKELERMTEIAPAHVDSPFDFSFPDPERMSDPLLSIQNGQLGYAGHAVIQDLNLGIHPGSRIGLLGANGAGKSTLIKSLAGDLKLLGGERLTGEHLKLGYFSQHQMEALDLAASPALHLQRLSPKATEQSIRNFLGGFNFKGDMALDPIRHFSGGEKARLALAILVWQKPNLLLLDEPTNHLDLEMCHALTVALQGFEGAVVVVSHDRYLLKNTVDQFLLVADGRALPYEDDLDAYSRWILSQKKNSATKSGAQPAKAGATVKKQQRQNTAKAREKMKSLTQSVKRVERKLGELATQLNDLESRLAKPDLYQPEQQEALRSIQFEQANCKREHYALEAQWLELHEALEDLQNGVLENG